MEALNLHKGSNSAGTPPPNSASILVSRYVLLKKLARGGTSTLYLAKDVTMKSAAVAIKRISPQLICQKSNRTIARREAELARQLSHPNIVNVYDVRSDKQTDFIVMEYLDGDSLKELLSRSSLRYQQILLITQSLAEALEYMHSKGIIHSDVKPGNVILTKDNQVKLIDFANCRQDSQATKPLISISKEAFFGYSLDYSSPQVMSDQPATKSDDVFSIACVLYEMLQGHSPIMKSENTGPAIDSAVLEASSNITPSSRMPVLDVLSKPKTINRYQWKILQKALSVDESQRYQSVRKFVQHFTFAKYTKILSAIFIIVFSLLLALSIYGWSAYTDYQNKVSVYHNYYQQHKSAENVIAEILLLPPLERYQSLGQLNDLTDSVRKSALGSLYFDVAFPVIRDTREKLLYSSTPLNTHENNDLGAENSFGGDSFRSILQRADDLLAFYPQSYDLSQLKTEVVEERDQQLNHLSIQITTLFNEEAYDNASVSRINSIAASSKSLGLPINELVNPSGYLEGYKLALVKTVDNKSFKNTKALYDHGQSLKQSLPELNQYWLTHNDDALKNALALGRYLTNGDYRLESFPVEAGGYFFGDQLKNIELSLNKAWYNKDIRFLAEQLVSLQGTYKIPKELAVFQSAYQTTINLIDKKIRFHRKKGQIKSVRLLSSLRVRLVNMK